MELDAAVVEPPRHVLRRSSIRVRMSSTFQAVVRGPSFTGLGKRPDFTPAHHVDRPTGIGPRGAKIEASRTKPAGGK